MIRAVLAFLEFLVFCGVILLLAKVILVAIAPPNRPLRQLTTKTVKATALTQGNRLLWTRGRVLTVQGVPRPDLITPTALVVNTLELGDVVITEDEVEVVTAEGRK